MQKIPLWGKIVGGCSILLLVFLFIAGCSAVVFVASNDGSSPTSEPTASGEKDPTTDPDPAPEKPTTDDPVVPDEPDLDTTDGINTCVPDQDQAMAEVVASITSADVTIYADQVYMVAEDSNLDSFYIVAGSDAGLLLVYTTMIDGEPVAFAANQTTYDYTLLDYPENHGAPAIDTDSDTYKVAMGCVS